MTVRGALRRSVTSLALVSAIALIAAGCGSRVDDDQAQAELLQDFGGRGIAAGGVDTTSNTVGGGPQGAGTTGGGAGTRAAGGPAGAGATTGGATGGSAPGAARSVGGATDIGVTASEIRIGNVSTLTGPVPGLFRGALIGTQAFAAYQNSRGGLFGRQLRVLSGDDQLDSGKNRAAHLQLKDQVLAFVGSFSVSDDGGASVLAECKCPDIGGSLSKARFNLPNHISPQPQPDGWRSGPPKWFAKKYPKEVIEHWALFGASVESTRAIRRGMEEIYKRNGFKRVYFREVQPNEQNFTGDVIQMQREGVRSLSWQGDVGNMARLARDMRQQNFVVDLANWGNSMYDRNAFTIAGEEALEGALIDQVYALFAGEDAKQIPEVALFNQWLKKIDPNQPVDLFSMYGWISGRLFVDAMTKASSPTRTNLLAGMKTITKWDANGIVAPVNPAGKKASDCFFVFTVTKGTFKRVFPTDGRSFACDVGPYVYL
jgi:ABC-type branched-subunit amino acid transport system substrate-binding protein